MSLNTPLITNQCGSNDVGLELNCLMCFCLLLLWDVCNDLLYGEPLWHLSVAPRTIGGCNTTLCHTDVSSQLRHVSLKKSKKRKKNTKRLLVKVWALKVTTWLFERWFCCNSSIRVNQQFIFSLIKTEQTKIKAEGMRCEYSTSVCLFLSHQIYHHCIDFYWLFLLLSWSKELNNWLCEPCFLSPSFWPA